MLLYHFRVHQDSTAKYKSPQQPLYSARCQQVFFIGSKRVTLHCEGLTLIENETHSTWNRQEQDRVYQVIQLIHMSEYPDLQESFSTAQRSKEQVSGEANLSTHSIQVGARPRKRSCLVLHNCNNGF